MGGQHHAPASSAPEPLWTLWSRQKKSLSQDGNRNRTVQPVARRYTDWAVQSVWIKLSFSIKNIVYTNRLQVIKLVALNRFSSLNGLAPIFLYYVTRQMQLIEWFSKHKLKELLSCLFRSSSQFPQRVQTSIKLFSWKSAFISIHNHERKIKRHPVSNILLHKKQGPERGGGVKSL
jgi:hypothetical protein